MIVDNGIKKKWEAAKEEKEKTEALVAASKRTLGVLSCTVDTGMDELVRLESEFCRLSLQVPPQGRWRRQSGLWNSAT